VAFVDSLDFGLGIAQMLELSRHPRAAKHVSANGVLRDLDISCAAFPLMLRQHVMRGSRHRDIFRYLEAERTQIDAVQKSLAFPRRVGLTPRCISSTSPA
jgi:hypothetical protein